MSTYVHRLERAVNELCKDIEPHVPPDVAAKHRAKLVAILGAVVQPFLDNPAFQEEETPTEPKPHISAPIARQVTH